jgi:hypothetical protein
MVFSFEPAIRVSRARLTATNLSQRQEAVDGNKTMRKQLKLLTARAYLIGGSGFDAEPKMERKDKDPCPHLSLFGPIVARPSRSPECVLTPRRSFVWFSPASTT